MTSEIATSSTLIDRLIQIQAGQDRIEALLGKLLATLSSPAPERIYRLSGTTSGSKGQVIPGAMVLEDEEAQAFFDSLGQPNIIPLNNLPPWTHMALARGTWWLIQIH